LFGPQKMTAALDVRRKRLLFRATHRGTKEADAIVGGFFREVIASLPEDKLDEAEALIEESDLDMMDWVMGRLEIPAQWRNSLFDGVLEYYRRLTKHI